ncbi:MAG: Lrp/AsnC family transcriptional regulator [Nanoarchaeota archaeon]
MENLDETDLRILAELDRNARMSTVQLAKKVHIGKETANYRVNTLQKKGILIKFVTMTNPARFGYSVFKVYIRYQFMTKDVHEEIIRWLTRHEYIYWVVSCKGKWDLNFCIFARSINQYDELMMPFFDLFGKHVRDQEINTTLVVGIKSKDWLSQKKKSGTKLVFFGGETSEAHIDKMDFEIMKTIANNGRMNATLIAEKIGTTPRIAIYRMRELEKKKIILGYTTSLDLALLGKQFFKAMISFSTFNKKVRMRIQEYCLQRPHIGFFIFCVGSWPLEIEFIVDDNAQFYKEMDAFQETFPEMSTYDFLIYPKEFKFDWVPQCYRPDESAKTLH